MKNKITLKINWRDTKPEIKTLHNFTEVNIYDPDNCPSGKKLRVICDNRQYYFPYEITTIENIQIGE